MNQTDIRGYRELSAQDVAEVNALKDKVAELRSMLVDLRSRGELYDQRCVSLAITHLEDCSFRAVKAIARPIE